MTWLCKCHGCVTKESKLLWRGNDRLWRDRRVNSHNTSMYYVMLTAFLKSRCVCVMSVKVLCVCLHLRARGRRSLKCSGDTLSIPEAQPPKNKGAASECGLRACGEIDPQQASKNECAQKHEELSTAATSEKKESSFF